MRITILFAPALLVAACSSSSDPTFGRGTTGTAQLCVPGQQAACTCTDGSNGSQTCAPEGDAYLPCSCTGSTTSSGSGGATTTGTGSGGTAGAGGQGGSGAQGAGGSGLLCQPGVSVGCYDGPQGTEGVGICTGGSRTCAPDGMSYGPCKGEVLPAPDDCATAADEDCNGSPVPCVNDMPWSERFACNDLTVMGLAVDPAGGILLTGYFYGTCDVGNGPLVSAGENDVILAKFDSSGKTLWSKRFGDAGQSGATSLAVDASGNSVIVGSVGIGTATDFGGGPLNASQGEGFIAKFDPAGGHVWSKLTTGAFLEGVTIDTGKNIIITGEFYGPADLGGGPVTPANEDLFVAKYAPNGSYMFADVWPFTGGYGGAKAVGVDGAGNIVATGHYIGALDLGGGPLVSSGINEFDVYLAKLDPSGNHVWSHRYGDQYQQRPGGIAVKSTGEIALTGLVQGNIDFGGGNIGTVNNTGNMFLAKFDPAGNHVFSYGWGDSQAQAGVSAAFGTGGNVFAIGNFIGAADFGGGVKTGLGGQDVAVVAFGPSGNHLFSGLFGGAGNDVAGAIAGDAFGKMVVAGSFPGTIDFGLGPLISTGGNNGFLAKLTP